METKCTISSVLSKSVEERSLTLSLRYCLPRTTRRSCRLSGQITLSPFRRGTCFTVRSLTARGWLWPRVCSLLSIAVRCVKTSFARSVSNCLTMAHARSLSSSNGTHWVTSKAERQVGVLSARVRSKSWTGVCIWSAPCASTSGAGCVAYQSRVSSTLGRAVGLFAKLLANPVLRAREPAARES